MAIYLQQSRTFGVARIKLANAGGRLFRARLLHPQHGPWTNLHLTNNR